MDEEQLLLARPAAARTAAAATAPGATATLPRLEQLALQELASARPPGCAGHEPADALMACLHWDLDSPPD